jgi:hypothetical protein
MVRIVLGVVVGAVLTRENVGGRLAMVPTK